MYGVQWFKVDRNIFNNRKIQLILKHKDGDLYFRVWIQLLSIAVECGNDGRLEIGQKPITFQDCAKIMGKTSDKIRRILEEFLELGMLQKEGETFLIKNWDKYQSIDKYENYQENNRQRKYREKLKAEDEKSNVTVTLSNVEEEKRREKKRKENKRRENNRIEKRKGG
ncbi:MAG: phage replisome organizer N-terminal domain-containing protein [Clostridia bacterium]